MYMYFEPAGHNHATLIHKIMHCMVIWTPGLRILPGCDPDVDSIHHASGICTDVTLDVHFQGPSLAANAPLCMGVEPAVSPVTTVSEGKEKGPRVVAAQFAFDFKLTGEGESAHSSSWDSIEKAQEFCPSQRIPLLKRTAIYSKSYVPQDHRRLLLVCRQAGY